MLFICNRETTQGITMKKWLLILLLVFDALLIASCVNLDKNEIQKNSSRLVEIPFSDFTMQVMKELEVTDFELFPGMLQIEDPISLKGSYMLILGHKFHEGESRDVWIDSMIHGFAPEGALVKNIVINDIPGVVATNTEDETLSTFKSERVGILATEKQGVLVALDTNTESIQEAYRLFDSIFQSIRINDEKGRKVELAEEVTVDQGNFTFRQITDYQVQFVDTNSDDLWIIMDRALWGDLFAPQVEINIRVFDESESENIWLDGISTDPNAQPVIINGISGFTTEQIDSDKLYLVGSLANETTGIEMVVRGRLTQRNEITDIFNTVFESIRYTK